MQNISLFYFFPPFIHAIWYSILVLSTREPVVAENGMHIVLLYSLYKRNRCTNTIFVQNKKSINETTRVYPLHYLGNLIEKIRNPLARREDKSSKKYVLTLFWTLLQVASCNICFWRCLLSNLTTILIDSIVCVAFLYRCLQVKQENTEFLIDFIHDM